MESLGERGTSQTCISIHPVCSSNHHLSLSVRLTFIRSGQNLSRETQRKGEEGKADRRRGGKTTLGNGQAWSSPSPKRAVENRAKWRKLVVRSSVVSQRPSRLRDR